MNHALSQGIHYRLIRHILIHPRMTGVKQRLRSRWWRRRAAALVNPAMPSRPRSLLFVCLGNICRSPFAAARAAQILEAKGHSGIRCLSAGIRPSQAASCPEEARVASLAYGISLDRHLPLALSLELMEDHDLIVVMEAGQLEQLRSQYPGLRDRIYLLPLFDAETENWYLRCHIADPFAQSRDVFDHCYRRIDRALDSLLTKAISQ